MGPNWNGDGKHDWQDDAFYNNVLNHDNNSKQISTPTSRKMTYSQPQKQQQQKKSKESSSSFGFTVLSLLYLALLLPGDIPINTFTTLIGIGAFIWLAKCFLQWLWG